MESSRKYGTVLDVMSDPVRACAVAKCYAPPIGARAPPILVSCVAEDKK